MMVRTSRVRAALIVFAAMTATWTQTFAAFDMFAAEFTTGTRLFNVDPNTGVTTPINTTRFLPGLDFRGNGVLYGSSSTLFTVNPSTGAATAIGALPDLIVSIAFSPRDELWGVNNSGTTLFLDFGHQAAVERA